MSLEKLETKVKFTIDDWEREGGGGGKTCVMEQGKVFERAGVNTSAVYGVLNEDLKQQLKTQNEQFFACGISLVIHPKNPFIPTVHANYRYFELYNKEELVDNWFGGGSDLTPYYLFEEDAIHFHKTIKNCCEKFNASYYPKFKNACDNYFYNKHRQEARGVGGIFFDHIKPQEHQNAFDFVQEMGNAFLGTYIPIIHKRIKTQYDQKHKTWQEIRRGRYVEFNLIHDLGTLFGLRSNGRIESILMSLPPSVKWNYNYTPRKHSEEYKLLQVLKKPKNWIV